MVEVNALGLLYCTKAAMPLIRDSGAATSSTSPRRRGPPRLHGRRRLQPDQVRRHRILGGAPPGGAPLEHPRHGDRARIHRHRAPGPQQESDRGRAIDEGEGADRRRCCRPRTSPARSATRSRSRRVSTSTRSSSGRRVSSAEAITQPSVIRTHRCRRRSSAPTTRPLPGRFARPCLRESMDLSLRDLAEPQRRQRADALAGRARRDQPDPGGRRQDRFGLDLTLSQLLRLDEGRHVVVTRESERRTPRRNGRRRRGADPAAARAARRRLGSHARRRAATGGRTTRRCTSPAAARRRHPRTARSTSVDRR